MRIVNKFKKGDLIYFPQGYVFTTKKLEKPALGIYEGIKGDVTLYRHIVEIEDCLYEFTDSEIEELQFAR